MARRNLRAGSRISPPNDLLSSREPVPFHINENLRPTNLIDQSTYNTCIHNMPIACVDVAIVNESKRILLVRRTERPASGSWWLPGGRVEKFETMAHTALRKAREEVGLECRLGPIIHTDETIFDDGPYDIPIHSINSCFILYTDQTKPMLDNTCDGWIWTSCIQDSFHPYVKTCMKEALKCLI